MGIPLTVRERSAPDLWGFTSQCLHNDRSRVSTWSQIFKKTVLRFWSTLVKNLVSGCRNHLNGGRECHNMWVEFGDASLTRVKERCHPDLKPWPWSSLIRKSSRVFSWRASSVRVLLNVGVWVCWVHHCLVRTRLNKWRLHSLCLPWVGVAIFNCVHESS